MRRTYTTEIDYETDAVRALVVKKTRSFGF